MNHTPEPWTFRTWATEDAPEKLKKLGLEPVSALSNDGDRYIRAVDKCIAWVRCQIEYKRGQGHLTTNDAERDANAARIVACVNGCAGLDPAAYRQVVEALKRICLESPDIIMQPHPMTEEPDYASPAGVTISGEAILAGRHALAQAEQP